MRFIFKIDTKSTEEDTPVFLNWAPAFPTVQGADLDCAYLTVDHADGTSGMWKDGNCGTDKIWAICEKGPTTQYDNELEED